MKKVLAVFVILIISTSSVSAKKVVSCEKNSRMGQIASSAGKGLLIPAPFATEAMAVYGAFKKLDYVAKYSDGSEKVVKNCNRKGTK